MIKMIKMIKKEKYPKIKAALSQPNSLFYIFIFTLVTLSFFIFFKDSIRTNLIENRKEYIYVVIQSLTNLSVPLFWYLEMVYNLNDNFKTVIIGLTPISNIFGIEIGDCAALEKGTDKESTQETVSRETQPAIIFCSDKGSETSHESLTSEVGSGVTGDTLPLASQTQKDSTPYAGSVSTALEQGEINNDEKPVGYLSNTGSALGQRDREEELVTQKSQETAPSPTLENSPQSVAGVPYSNSLSASGGAGPAGRTSMAAMPFNGTGENLSETSPNSSSADNTQTEGAKTKTKKTVQIDSLVQVRLIRDPDDNDPYSLEIEDVKPEKTSTINQEDPEFVPYREKFENGYKIETYKPPSDKPESDAAYDENYNNPLVSTSEDDTQQSQQTSNLENTEQQQAEAGNKEAIDQIKAKLEQLIPGPEDSSLDVMFKNIETIKLTHELQKLENNHPNSNDSLKESESTDTKKKEAPEENTERDRELAAELYENTKYNKIEFSEYGDWLY